MSHKSNITFLGLALPPNHPALATHPSGGDGRYTPSRFAEDLKAMHVDVAKSPYQGDTFMLDPAKDNDTVVKEFLSKITEKEYGAVMIGWSIRGHPEYTDLFEKMVNAVRTNAPKCALCFNTKASDTIQSLDRVLKQ